MKRSLVSVLLLCGAVLAQTAGEVEITSEPHHHLALENQYVRLFQVDVPPGKATLMHRHGHDYVYVTLGDAAIENNVEGKPPATLTLKDGQTNFTPGNFAHLVKTVSDSPFRNVTIELLQDEKAHHSAPAKWDEERGVQILEGGMEDILFVKDNVRVSDIQLQPRAMIPLHRHPGPRLLVAVSNVELRTSPTGRTSTPVALKAGEVKWIPAGPAHTLMNVGTRQARFIVLEFAP
jgi:quercetin dioxygenase-like cupin family protein